LKEPEQPRPVRAIRVIELLVVTNVVIVGVLLYRIGVRSYALDYFGMAMRQFGDVWCITMLLGVLARWGASRLLHRPALMPGRNYLVDGPRLFLVATLMLHGYGWLKVMIPALNPRNFDAFLWDLDRVLGLGFQPNVFFLTLFSAPIGLKLIAFSYSRLFELSLIAAGFWFLTDPDRSRRWGFATGLVLLWIWGSWLYLAVPSLGPCYRFPEVFAPHSASIQSTIDTQRLLAGNYVLVRRFVETGTDQLIVTTLGIAAFPSLHVGHIAYLFFWARRARMRYTLLLGVFTALMFVGSVVTGWHYMSDSIAGLLMAWFAVRVGGWIARKEFGVDPFESRNESSGDGEAEKDAGTAGDARVAV